VQATQATEPSPTPNDTHRGTNRHDAGLQTSRPSAFAHADTRRAPRRAADCAPPCPRPPLHARKLRTSPGCRPRRAWRPRPRRLASKRTSPRAPAPLAHADARPREHLTVTPGCESRAPDAKARGRCLENRHWACRTNAGFERSMGAWRDDEEAVRVGLTGCARDQPCASWGSRLPTSKLNDRRLGLTLVVQRSAKVRGSAGRDNRALKKKHAAEKQ